jgi:hypothetical protein
MATQKASVAFARTNLKLSEDGAIATVIAEQLALMVADGVKLTDAWRALGKTNTGGMLAYRQNIERDPVYIARVETLMAEKDLVLKDDVWGEMRWMALQLWREARAARDYKLMEKAADMRMKVADRQASARQAIDAPAEIVDAPSEKRAVGRPVTESPQTKIDMAAIKDKLIHIGLDPAEASAPE